MQKKLVLVALACMAVLVSIILWNGKSQNVVKQLMYPSLPTFELPYLDKEGVFSSNEMDNGEVWVVNIWASWCSPCRKEFPLLIDMKSKASSHVKWLGINYSDSADSAKEWLNFTPENLKLFDILLSDAQQVLKPILNIRGVPETLLIKDGKILYRHARDIRNPEEAAQFLKRIKEVQ